MELLPRAASDRSSNHRLAQTAARLLGVDALRSALPRFGMLGRLRIRELGVCGHAFNAFDHREEAITTIEAQVPS